MEKELELALPLLRERAKVNREHLKPGALPQEYTTALLLLALAGLEPAKK
jgi:hypothetical protein